MARDTRERLLRTARDLVHGTSLAEVSIEDICAGAGVHRGSLYHFFPSKEALGLAVLDLNWTMMQAVLDEAFQAEVEPLARIDRFIDGFARMLGLMREKMGATPGCPLGDLTTELSAQPGPGRDRSQNVLRAWTRYFVDAIREARARGQLTRTTDPEAAALRVLAYLQGMALLAKVYDDPALVATTRTAVRSLIDQTD
ncbi:TetR/AcrR family transcriptional regulator [Solwaraspora sp. WMMD792]|uniref:TetR/AcrR family transcriptional regulator n=1 Tax=Solwaraspora sp. WMMD792 TaxID=3016099 RepID=UPI0024164FBD|nr:TetR/AcrR family transcriptional regulator [Solwaraspora sp. WMMD792]MDG4772897.1 TetR/AcrR family transcriptional regulator [Solwaraspora sp. WMMD792]